jgi:hypothetical protein
MSVGRLAHRVDIRSFGLLVVVLFAARALADRRQPGWGSAVRSLVAFGRMLHLGCIVVVESA